MDPELEALNKINEAIKDLQEDAKVRVVAWLINKYSILSGQPVNTPLITPKSVSGGNTDEEEVIEGDNQTISSFSNASELLAKCKPQKSTEKILVIASYLQTKNPAADLTAFEINHVLKNIGHKVSGISHRMSDLMAGKPQYMIQTKKSGKSRQARKGYRVTDEGIKEVERLLKNQ